MASPIRSGRVNGVGYRSTTDLNLVSGGVVTDSNTNRVFRSNLDGTWTSYRPSRSINGFTSMTKSRAGTDEYPGNGSGNVYLLDASANFGIAEQLPLATVAEGSGSTPSANADDTTYIHTISGYDRIPNYALHSGTVVNSNGTGGGDWSSGSSWSGGSAPAAGNVVRIRSGDTVVVDGVISTEYLVVSVENGGTLAFSTSADTELHAQTVQVRETGTLTMGTPGAPVPNGTTCHLVFNDASVDTTFDPNQWGNGLVVLGTFTACGHDRGLSFFRSSHERSAGHTSITLAAAASNWQAADRVVIPDTRHLKGSDHLNLAAGTYTANWESRTIASLASGNTVLNLSSSLTYDHKGPRDDAGTLETQYLWHVGNLTRNVVIESENASGTRGHCVFTSHARIDVRNALFKNLGRTTSANLDNTTFDGGGVVTHLGTNQVGKYPVHFHHCGGREPISFESKSWQYLFLGNAIDNGDATTDKKWGVTIHGTHWGLVRNNVCYNVFGAGIVLEDGSETNNLIDANFLCRVHGYATREDGDDATKGFARNGAGLWCRSGLSRFRDNVSASCVGYGLVLNATYLGNVLCPTYPGVHLHSGASAGAVSVQGQRLPFVAFDGHEHYGPSLGAMTCWWLGSIDLLPEFSVPRTVLKGVVCWHPSTYGTYLYPCCNLTLKDWVVRGDQTQLTTSNEGLNAVWPGDYKCSQFLIDGMNVQNVHTGIKVTPFPSDHFWVRNSTIRCGVSAIIETPGSPGSTPSGTAMVPGSIRFEGCDLTPTTQSVFGVTTKYEVYLVYTNQLGWANHVVDQQIRVIDRNGVAGASSRLYFTQQAAGEVVPASSGQLVGCPESGLTNQQAHDKYVPYDVDVGASTPVKSDNPNPNTPGLCIAGAIAPPGTTTPSWTNGLAEAI